MANARLTFGALLNSVTAVAGIVTTAADATADAAQYGGNFVSNALNEQRMRIEKEAVDLEDRINTEVATAIVQRAVETKKFVETSEFHAEQYAIAMERIVAAGSKK